MHKAISIIIIFLLLLPFLSHVYANDDNICSDISNIKVMPFKNETIDDFAYNKIISSGDKALPCLIANVANMTLMNDPRKAPYYNNMTIGDVSFFLFLDITKQQLIEFMPPHVLKKYQDHGVYAYFEYSSKIENRIELQTKLINWIINNRKQ